LQPARLAVALAHAGVGSRRACDALVQAGRVTVDGQVVREPGTRVDLASQPVCVDGERVAAPPALQYLVLYKPRGVVSTTSDPEGRRTVLDLVPQGSRLYPVGRLDAASEGLLLLTNDGALAQRLLHPSFEVPRLYRVSVEGVAQPEALERLVDGVELPDGEVARVRAVRAIGGRPGRTRLEIVLTEGKRRQIRLMLEAVGHPVRRLVRVAFGPLFLGSLGPGEVRPLRPEEAEALRALVAPAPVAGTRTPVAGSRTPETAAEAPRRDGSRRRASRSTRSRRT
jgi:23S rRNA pseudouridine2605 synthase